MITRFRRHQRIYFCTSSRPTSAPLNISSPNFVTQQCNNDFISSLCRQKRFREALQAFHSLRVQKPNFQLHPSTYAHLFLACSHLKSLHHGRLVYHHLTNSGVPADVILRNHIINMYGKCGSLDEARQLFDVMPERNLVSWTSMISGYSQNHLEWEAVELYIEMLRSGLAPDQFALGSVVKACSGLSDVELGKQLHCHAVKSDHGAARIVQNALITMYSKSERIENASVVFERIAEKDLISWGSMIAGFGQQGCELEALHLFKEMLHMGVHRPNEFLFGSAFSACGSILQSGLGEQLHGLSIKFGLENDTFAGCSLSDMYARCGRLDCAKKAFYAIDMPDLVCWNSIINAFSCVGLTNESMLFFSEMRDFGLQPDDITARCLLCACTGSDSLRQGQLVHSYVLKIGLDSNIAVQNTLLMMYSKCSDVSTALGLFNEMNDWDLVSWNTILTACLQHQQSEEVFHLLKLMRSLNSKLDRITLNTLLSACADLGYLEMGNQVHAYALKVGLEADVMVRNGLIDTYAKCGSLDDAKELFDWMGNNRDVFSWSSLIVGYAQFGYAKESLKLFACMQSLGIRPNHVTFVGVLTACSRVGLVDEGCYYYSIMKVEHGITPTREHCSCVVDLLARAGRLSEAETFIDQMPFEPDVVMWKTLLAACRMYHNVEIGKRAAEEILKMDPSNSAAYVLLCNIYASSGHWDDFAMLRKLMKSSGVRKVPGKSWIKVRGEVSVFIVEDRSHLESEAIYVMLKLLGFEMREAGYAPKASI
ncbi:pentatricopeptide repeat-containing protein At3g53360, mitochondrial [Elaeis guineensis]|uniref:Pentatricopeptide repeat-containing protein At3g53360, mitochondrial n=1 Tax=Elaeis guineensis var. tenera TaxID=51953 RepID=A0A6I9RIS4_ELAGV|nr:pentatricopeptide repeat-containing protein At3g53360, mitochondrial [Elaeis guineensis]